MALTPSKPKRRKPRNDDPPKPTVTGFEQRDAFESAARFAGMALTAPASALPAEFGFARELLGALQAEFANAGVAYATAETSGGSIQEFIPSMITQDDAEKAVDYLRDSARRAAKARAEFGYLDSFSKVVKAKLMREHGTGLAIGAQESLAYSHSSYQTHLEAVRIAAEAMEYERYMREAASAKFEGWRTQQANERAARP